MCAATVDRLQEDIQNAFEDDFPCRRSYKGVVGMFVMWDPLEQEDPNLSKAIEDW